MALTVLVGCSRPPETDALASWEGGTVTAAQLDAAIRELPVERKQPAGGQAIEEWIGARITDLALPQLLLARPGEVAAVEQSALALRARYLASQELGRRYLLSRCPAPTIGDEELSSLYDEAYPDPSQAWILVRHIYKRVLPGSSASQRQAAREALEALRPELGAGASFIELARLHSDSETATEGGLIGRLSRLAPIEVPVRETAWGLADGEISDVVEVSNGFHLLLRERSGSTPRPTFDQARERLQRQASQSRQQGCGSEVLKELGRATTVTADREALVDIEAAGAALTIGEEGFTPEQLAGLSPELEPLMFSPRPGELLRHFSEAILLAEAAQQEFATPQQYAALEARQLQQLLAEARWRRERRQRAADRPEAQIRAHFDEHRDRFMTDLELDVGLIVVSSQGEPGRRLAMETAQATRSRIADGESFEALAEAASEHASREEGGRLGSLPLPRLRVILGSRGMTRAARLSIDEVSEPVQIQDPPSAAFALVKLYARTEPRARTFEEAREDVINTLGQERIQQLDREVREALLADAGFALHSGNIAAYVARLSD